MRSVDLNTQILLIVVGLNGLLVGLFQFDLVAAIYGRLAAAFARVVYIVVRLSAVYQALRIPIMMDKAPSGVVSARPFDRRWGAVGF